MFFFFGQYYRFLKRAVPLYNDSLQLKEKLTLDSRTIIYSSI